MAVSVTNTSITDFNSLTEVTANAATAPAANGTEVFTFTPDRVDHRYLIIINNVATDQGSVTYSIAAGGFPQGKAQTGTVEQGKKKAIIVDAVSKSATGTIVVTFTPATGKILLTNHALECYAIGLPF